MDGTDSARGQRGQLGRAHLHPGKISEQKGRRGENVNQTDTPRTRRWETKAHGRDKGQVRGVFVKGSTRDILFLNVHLLGSRATLRKKQWEAECGGREVEDRTGPESLIPILFRSKNPSRDEAARGKKVPVMPLVGVQGKIKRWSHTVGPVTVL